jgi:hypothetical protein
MSWNEKESLLRCKWRSVSPVESARRLVFMHW